MRRTGGVLACLAVLTGSGWVAADPGSSPDEGLVSYWSFENRLDDVGVLYTSGTGVADDNLAAQGGAARYVAGQVGQALAIGSQVGDAVFLNTPDSDDVRLPATYTIECWIHPTELAGDWQRMVLRWGAPLSYHLALRRLGAEWTVSLFHGQTAGTSNADGGSVVVGQWQHVAGVADGSMLRTYLNGVEVASAPYDGTIDGGGTEGLGLADSFVGNSGMSYNGYIDELAIWDLPLTPEEILSHWEAGPDGYGLQLLCEEATDGVTISGPGTAGAGQAVQLTAAMSGVDPGRSATYAWSLVSGVATLGPTSAATLGVTPGEPGTVVVRVTAGDGLCTDTASATYSLIVLPSGDPGTSPDEGLVSYWSFDEGTTDDASTYTNGTGVAIDNLTPQGGGSRLVPGIVGQALAIGAQAGDAVWLNAPESGDVDLPATYTIEAWVYPTLLDEAWQRLVLRWQGQLFYHFALRLVGGTWTVSLFHQQAGGGQVNADGGSVALQQWQHVAGVADGTSIRVYLNGVEVNSVPYDGTINGAMGTGLGLGDMAGGNGLRYNGYVDELAIWSVPLTPEEILSHYEAGTAGYGLTVGCAEERDSVAISGPAAGIAGGSVDLTATMSGVDPGRQASYAWELVSGTATLGATNAATLRITKGDLGRVVVKVSAGDGRCEDLATATYAVGFFSGVPGLSPGEGLVSLWEFEDQLADVADDYPVSTSAAADLLTPQGGAARFAPGIVGKALAIGDAPEDPTYLTAPESADIDLPATYTIEAWILPTVLDGDWQRLVLRWEAETAYHLALKRIGSEWTASLYHRLGDGVTDVYADGGSAVVGAWQHIAGVADGEYIRVYLDGEEVASAPYDGTIYHPAGVGLGLGEAGNGSWPPYRYNGLVDEVAIWNVPLSAGQVRSHYEAGPAGYGLSAGCSEELDRVSIAGPTTGLVNQTIQVTATAEGVDPGRAATYRWELVSGVALLGPLNGPTLSITGGDASTVVVQVTAGDGLCDDSATARHTVTFFTGQPGTSPASGLVSYWSFDDTTDDEAAGFAPNVGVADDNATAQGGTARFVEGMRGQSIAIGVEVGDAAWLDAPDSPDVDLPATYTIEAWVHPTDLSGPWQRLALRWGGIGLNSYHFAIRNEAGFSNAVSLFHAQGSDSLELNANGGTVAANTWQHIAGVADGEFLRVYLNGEEVDAAPYDGTIVGGTSEPLGIGESATAFLEAIRYNGYLDELAIWNVPLSASQLRSHFEAGPGGYGLGGGGAPTFKRGDADSSGEINITDGIYVLNFLFLGGPDPTCMDAADGNDDGATNITDGIYILNFLFLGGAEPPAPGPSACGVDPPPADDLDCASYPAC